MTCQECEIKLGMGEDADEHLASCLECRALAREVRLNSVALGEMRAPRRVHWEWVLVAAAIVMAIGVWKMPVAPRRQVITAAHGAAPQQQQTLVPVSQRPVLHKKRIVRRPPTVEPLRVKMFTSDPDVVIYWIVDKKEGFE
jgi:hypothetical protein